jgi:hypothetical protein
METFSVKIVSIVLRRNYGTIGENIVMFYRAFWPVWL